MPCYCDIPDEEDQVEIENRAKLRMYWDALDLLTFPQVELANILYIRRCPDDNINQSLCKLCKIMTNEQMEEISAYYYQIKWQYKNLFDWYQQHLIDDSNFNSN